LRVGDLLRVYPGYSCYYIVIRRRLDGVWMVQSLNGLDYYGTLDSLGDFEVASEVD
jgi:hypothetical protein